MAQTDEWLISYQLFKGDNKATSVTRTQIITIPPSEWWATEQWKDPALGWDSATILVIDKVEK